MSIDLNQLSDQQLYILKSRSNTPLTGLKRINMIKSIETKIKNGEIQIDEAKNFDMNISKKKLEL